MTKLYIKYQYDEYSQKCGIPIERTSKDFYILENVEVKIGKSPIDELDHLYFKTDSEKSKFLEEEFSRNVFTLSFSKQIDIPSIIKIDQFTISESEFMRLFKSKLIEIEEIRTRISNLKIGDKVIKYNVIIFIFCKTVRKE